MKTQESFPLPVELVGDGELFLLRAGGPAAGAGIADGDWVIIREQEAAENGEIVAAMIDGDAVVRPYDQVAAGIEAGDVTVIGKVVAVLRRL